MIMSYTGKNFHALYIGSRQFESRLMLHAKWVPTIWINLWFLYDFSIANDFLQNCNHKYLMPASVISGIEVLLGWEMHFYVLLIFRIFSPPFFHLLQQLSIFKGRFHVTFKIVLNFASDKLGCVPSYHTACVCKGAVGNHAWWCWRLYFRVLHWWSLLLILWDCAKSCYSQWISM